MSSFFFSSRRRHTRCLSDWSSDVCSSDLIAEHIANLGTNTFVLHQFQWAQGFDSFLNARRRNQPIRVADYEFLRDNLQMPLQESRSVRRPTPGSSAQSCRQA